MGKQKDHLNLAACGGSSFDKKVFTSNRNPLRPIPAKIENWDRSAMRALASAMVMIKEKKASDRDGQRVLAYTKQLTIALAQGKHLDQIDDQLLHWFNGMQDQFHLTKATGRQTQEMAVDIKHLSPVLQKISISQKQPLNWSTLQDFPVWTETLSQSTICSGMVARYAFQCSKIGTQISKYLDD